MGVHIPACYVVPQQIGPCGSTLEQVIWARNQQTVDYRANLGTTCFILLNKFVLEHGMAHLFIYYRLWLLLCCNRRGFWLLVWKIMWYRLFVTALFVKAKNKNASKTKQIALCPHPKKTQMCIRSPQFICWNIMEQKYEQWIQLEIFHKQIKFFPWRYKREDNYTEEKL